MSTYQMGNTQVALDAYQKSLEIGKTLAANDPESAQAQRDLSVSYNKLGNVNLSLGNTQVALDAYQKSLRNSQNPSRQRPPIGTSATRFVYQL
jgi:tetratricopeptide (TPR) repeat protein